MPTEGGDGRAVMSREHVSELAELSPFEFKARLSQLAAECTSADRVLDAGRGNPNWIATTPRAAFFLLGQFGAAARPTASGRNPTSAACPTPTGIAARFDEFLDRARRRRRRRPARRERSSTARRSASIATRSSTSSPTASSATTIPGPTGSACTPSAILREYLADELCQGEPPAGDLEPVRSRGRHRGDLLHLRLARQQPAAAAGRPHRVDGARVHALPRDARASTATASTSSSLRASRGRPERRPDVAVPRLGDRQARRPVGARAVRRQPVEPAVGDARARDARAHRRPSSTTNNPDLIIVTDDVYGTFVPDFLSLMDVAAREHDRGLLVLEVLRRDRLAARRDRDPREQRDRPPICAHERRRARRARPPLRVDRHRHRRHPVHRPHGRRQSPGRARTTPPGCRCRNRCR